MARLPSMPLFVDDFEAATSHLTLEEDGAYNRLLRLCWRQTDCSIPDDDAWVRRHMRCDEATFERLVRPLIDEFFTRSRGRIWQKRQRQEHARVTASMRRRQKAGSAGGAAKALKTNKSEPSNAVAISIPITNTITTESDTDSEFYPPPPELDPNFRPAAPVEAGREPTLDLEADPGRPPPPKLVKPTQAQLEQCFDERFWPLYPRKVGKPKARKAFVAKAKAHAAKTIVVGLRQHVEAWQRAGREQQFIPHPTTWLNQERYLEQPDVPAGPEPSRQPALSGVTGYGGF